MAIQWGSWEYSGGNGMRTGVDVSVSSVSTSSSSVTFTYDIYTENQYRYDDPQVLTYGGNSSGTTSYTNSSGSNSSGGGAVKRATKTYTYTYSTYGSSPGSTSFSATVSGAYNGVTPSVTRTTTIPARPYAVPNAISSVNSVRNSDTQATTTWTRNTTSQKPYTSQTVQMRTYTGATWGAWATVATVSATATSYVKTGLSANHAYQFQVRANNSVGSSGFAAGPVIYMTPGAPNSADASISSSGTQITTTWKNTAYDSGSNTITIERSVNGAAYTVLSSTLARTTTSYTDTTPGAGTNTYRVKMVNASASALSSAYSTSDTVTTVVPPLAPTSLLPNGTKVDLSFKAVTLTWKHNPGTDKAKQSAFTIQYSSNGGTSWVALTADITSTVSSYTIPAGTLANGIAYLWRVRTRGATTAAFGPYSASATITGTTTPTVTFDPDAPASPVMRVPLDIAWAYNQDEGSAQVAWEANLYAADGTTLLESLSGTTEAAAVFSYPVVDAATYVVQLRAQSALGLWSDWVSATAVMALPKPAVVIATATYQTATGSVVLHIEKGVPTGTEVEVIQARVDRLVPGGEWVTLGTVDLPNDFIDPLPDMVGANTYRFTSVSAVPSYRSNTDIVVTPPNGGAPGSSPDLQWVFLNYGSAFDQLLRFRSMPSFDETSSRRKDALALLGRTNPLLLLGVGQTREVSVSGSLVFDPTGNLPDAYLWDSPPNDWIEAGLEAGVVCYRDFTGRRMFGTLSEVKAKNELLGLGSVGFSVTKVDYTETYLEA